MPPSRVVVPSSRRIEISNGDWLLVKDRLNHGEQDEAFARRYIAEVGGTRTNLKQVGGMSTITAYLLDWSLTGLDGKKLVIQDEPIEVMEGHLDRIGPEDFEEILIAIQAHETAMAAERAAQKKILSGSPNGAATSSSPSAPDDLLMKSAP